MEGTPNLNSENANESFESVEHAKELYAQLMLHHNTDVVGREALNKVEKLAHDLGLSLKDIPKSVRQKEGLPWHPYESLEEMSA